MKILAIETATAASSVAIGVGQRVVAMAAHVDARGHVGFVVPALDFCFRTAGWQPRDIDVVAVDVGPGLFTGIRTGLATAQAIAGAIGAPLVPVTSLDAIALRAATGRRRIWSVVDARRGELAVAPYQPVPGGVVRDGPIELMSADGLRATLESDAQEGLVVGNVDALPEGFFTGLHSIKVGRPRYPTADALLGMAARRAGQDEIPHPDEVRPRYLREPDVAINWSTFREEGPWQT